MPLEDYSFLTITILVWKFLININILVYIVSLVNRWFLVLFRLTALTKTQLPTVMCHNICSFAVYMKKNPWYWKFFEKSIFFSVLKVLRDKFCVTWYATERGRVTSILLPFCVWTNRPHRLTTKREIWTKVNFSQPVEQSNESRSEWSQKLPALHDL